MPKLKRKTKWPKIRKKAKVDIKQDLISNLPDEIKSEILMALPILDAVKTSILAKKWRNVWASIPKLCFYEEDITSSTEFISIIDQVLSLHTGSIQGFCLKNRTSFENALYRWLFILSRHPIDEISIVSEVPHGNRIPSILFSFELLEFLELEKCILTIPQTFNGFAALSTLNLTKMSNIGGLSRLLSCCPLLANLFILDCKFGTEIDIAIYAPKLLSLYISGPFRCIHLCTPELVEAEIEPFIDSSNEVQSIVMKKSLNETLGDLPAVEMLKLFREFLPNVDLEFPSQTLPIALKNLRHLELEIDLHSDSEVGLALISFLRGAPLLEYLRLAACARIMDPDRADRIMNFWSSENNQNCIFKNLKFLMIEFLEYETTPIVVLENLLEFLEFIVGTAPVLEKLTIMDFFSSGGEEEMVLLKRLLMFPRASSKAQILVC